MADEKMAEKKIRHNIGLIFMLNNALIKQKQANAWHNLTSIQADVLSYILINSKKGEINQLDIQAVFKLTNPTVSGIIDRLEEKEFIKRTKSEKDARYRKLVPLPKGEELMQILAKAPETRKRRLWPT